MFKLLQNTRPPRYMVQWGAYPTMSGGVVICARLKDHRDRDENWFDVHSIPEAVAHSLLSGERLWAYLTDLQAELTSPIDSKEELEQLELEAMLSRERELKERVKQ